MKERIALLIIDGYQVAMSGLALLLITVAMMHHLLAGNLSFTGMTLFFGIWCIVYHLWRHSLAERKQERNSETSND